MIGGHPNEHQESNHDGRQEDYEYLPFRKPSAIAYVGIAVPEDIAASIPFLVVSSRYFFGRLDPPGPRPPISGTSSQK